MPEHTPLWVEYPGAGPTAEPVVVERITPDAVNEDFARGVITTVRDAYTMQFGDRFVPTAAITAELNPDDEIQVAERQRNILKRVTSGEAQYWVVRSEADCGIRGLSKVLHNRSDTVYIGDIIVAPPWRDGLGSRLLHAPGRYGGYDPNSRVELDAFEGSSVNAWYVRLGFRPTGVFGSFDIGDRSLLTQRVAIPSTVGLDGLVRTLEEHNPALARATVRQVV